MGVPRVIGHRGAAGFALRCYTIKDDAVALRLFGWGVKAVFTAYPDRISSA
jgi:glycerophosphoryl diester phosphodiesterase